MSLAVSGSAISMNLIPSAKPIVRALAVGVPVNVTISNGAWICRLFLTLQ